MRIYNMRQATEPQRSKTEGSRDGKGGSKGSKSGHARTHAIVINLDDKSRFSEEVTV